jgi:hypothetical protein
MNTADYQLEFNCHGLYWRIYTEIGTNIYVFILEIYAVPLRVILLDILEKNILDNTNDARYCYIETVRNI